MMNSRLSIGIVAILVWLLLFSLTVYGATLIKSRQIDTNWKGFNLTNVTTLEAQNVTFDGLNASEIRAVDVLQLGGVDVATIGNIFSNENFTARYDLRTDRFDLNNYSVEYGSTGFGLGNYSVEYGLTGFSVVNFTEQVAAYDTFYKKANLTLNYPNLDLSLLDDFNYANNLSAIPIAVTFNGVAVFNSDVLFFDNVSFVNLGRINTSIMCAVDATCDLGNGTNRWRSANFSSMVEMGALNVDTGTLFVDSGNSRVGIGTTNPDGTLEVQASTAKIIINSSSTGDADPSIEFRTETGTKAFLLYNENLAQFSIYVNNSHRLVVLDSGDVGIGTLAPSQKLTVKGTLSVTADSTEDPNLFVASDGNVGIGTVLPTQALEVDGNITLVAGFLNQTGNGTIRVFFNGCTEKVNDSGYHIIC